MNAAAHLLILLRSAGIAVSVDGDEVRCRAAKGVITPALVLELRALKPAVLDLLITEQNEIDWRAETIGDGLLAESTERTPGHCSYCGGAMPGRQTGKCVLCSLASITVLERRSLSNEASHAAA